MDIQTKPRAAELLAQMAGGGLYSEAYKRGMNLSVWLEKEDPSTEYKDGLDAFERLLKLAGIVTRGRPEYGYFSDAFEAFDQNDATRSLVPEWVARQWRKAQTGRNQSTRDMFSSSDEPLASALRPYTDDGRPRQSQLAPAIPLDSIVSMTTPIDSDAYRAFYLQEPSAASVRLLRVAEGAEMPRAKLVGGDRNIRLYKYGRVLEVTYETLRRQRIDKVAFWLQRLAIQAEVDKVDVALDTLINGDGNANTAATVVTMSSLDPAAVLGTLSLKAWLAFKAQWPNPYQISTAFARQDVALALRLLSTGNANIPLLAIAGAANFGGLRPINEYLADTVALGMTQQAPASKIVGTDNRFALERVVEVGSNINEVVRFATRQTQAITMSETEGYAVFDQKATKVLDIAS
jgi:hypothetical protein